ncbi:Peptidyl-prolyl cis-trans isomerase CWC27 like protein [Eufriesea mexicana]|uniref:Peptidyl-prolyl cis-trans isomerase CWC27 like protein n=1 Tax=Eufriesea mexicana TaxID=516756 RepID=A0A310SGT4_9HYME|nr:Peptidyl-prolyl cis-trans isomerase CWC27 like protein [Eufriesea mexicana]
MLKLDEALVDENHRPLHPPKMRKTEILNNPFSDIIPRIIVQESEEVKDSLETKTAGVKDFDLLSFDEEAKGDEEESVILNEKISGEDKSAHDHLSGSKLSSQPADEPPGFANKKERKTAVVIRKVSMKAHPTVMCTDWHPGRLRSTDPRIAPDASPARKPPEISTHDEIDSGRNECRRRAVRMTYVTRSCRVHGK